MFAIANAMRDRGWHVELAVGSDAGTARFIDSGFAVHIVPGLALGDRSAGRMAKGAAKLRQIIAGTGFEVVHSFNAQAGLMAWIAGLGRGVKVVNTVQGEGKEGLLKRMPFPLLAVSEFMRHNLVHHGVKPDRIRTVLNSIMTPDRVLGDTAAFDAAWTNRGQSDGEFRLVGIAMMNGDKGHRCSIESFAQFAERNPDIRATLTLVGDGTLRRSLEEFATKRGVGERVRFTGALDNVFDELDRAHAFLHLSPKETFGLVLAEAHARGLPAIAYSIGGIPEVVANGESGILCTLGDIEAVTTAIARLADDRGECMAMGRRGLDRVRRLFMRDIMAQRMETIYASL